jgi:hypothetical protein
MNTVSHSAETQINWIEDILQEASAYNLRLEVIESANKFIKEYPDMDKIVAHQLAYMKWIK